MKSIPSLILALLAGVLVPTHAGTPFREGDLCEIRLSGPPEEFTKEFNVVLQVDDGKVNVPMIGRVVAAGMTTTQLASTIEQRLKQAKLFTDVNVNITPTSRRTVIVSGAVHTPGIQNWVPELTLTGAISAAGGPTEFLKDGMKIIRGGKATVYSRKAIRKNPALDPRVEPGDIIEQEGE